MQVFINNSVRFCYYSDIILYSNTFGKMQIWTRKDKKNENLIDDFLKSESDELDNADNDSNDETKYRFHNNLLLYLVSLLCFFDNKFFHWFFIYS